MAFLGEIGQKFPVVAEGFEVPVDDETTEMYAGDVMETQFSVDGDLTADAIQEIVHGVLKMKEEYPYFVLHYLKFETRTITAQYSIAPVGQTGSALVAGLVWRIATAILAIIGAIALLYLLRTGVERNYILRGRLPTGNALVHAIDSKTKLGVPNVKITVSDREGTTGPDGGAVLFEDLLAGPYVFTGETVSGYHPPQPIQQSVIKDQQIIVEIFYIPEDEPPPTHGFVIVLTDPVSGEVWIGGTSYGFAPIKPVELPIGNYDIWYGTVEGYIKPKPDVVTVVGGQTATRIGYYTLPEERWYEKYLMYALIGGGAILGASLLIPQLIRAITRRKTK